MKRAVISDIHGNLEALEAVLADIRRQDISEIYCLGDLIGYGPNPLECIDLAMDFDVCVQGNRDGDVFRKPETLEPEAEHAISWTRQQLESSRGDTEANALRWEFLGKLPTKRCEAGLLFIHGSARDPLSEYVFPEDIYNQRKMDDLFSQVKETCFQGHTHVPGVFTEGCRFFAPEDIEFQYRLGDEKVMVNVGSVGQPRDGDSRACYVKLENDLVTFHRVDYDVSETSRKMGDMPE